jgi:hypothetical protein
MFRGLQYGGRQAVKVDIQNFIDEQKPRVVRHLTEMSAHLLQGQLHATRNLILKESRNAYVMPQKFGEQNL